MTDLYDERIDAMKADERFWDMMSYGVCRLHDADNAISNAERLAAYHKKRWAFEIYPTP